MNSLQSRLQELNPDLFSRFENTMIQVELLLAKFSENFPTYTDHSLTHTKQVFKIVSEMLTTEEINNLNGEEVYVLSMSCILHDIGMCLPENVLLESFDSDRYKEYRLTCAEGTTKESMIRDIHHELSYDFIKQEQELLNIPNENFAEAIALVSMGHRKVQLDDIKRYVPKFFVKDGRDFVCLPYLASVLRLADELDITNIRTPKLLTKYYMPNNEVSIKEWEKHIATTQINYTEDQVIFQVNCSDQNNLAALEEQFEKIQNVANYAQKIIRNISNTDGRKFLLQLSKVIPHYKYIGFDPKGIKFSFNVNNVVNTFIGKDLYGNDLTALREVLQNAIDSCRYKSSINMVDYTPEISMEIKEESIVIHDNGLGMDEFIIENFFGKLGSSFYSEEKVKSNYEAIGQFGVGVFSYFLLGEYIDIETKTIQGQTIKFRIDKDPKNYFHFYDETNRVSEGTTITLHLNDIAQKKYSSNDYIKYIENRFRHIEFPILIKNKKNDILINGTSPSCLKEKEIPKRVKIQFREKVNQLETLSVKISNDEFEGECSIIVPILNEKSDLSIINRMFNSSSFGSEARSHNYSSVAISQKGVFVSDYSIEIIKFSVGQINILKSLPINISRNDFSNQNDVDSILFEFGIKLADKLLNKLNTFLKDKSVRNKVSNDFLHYYLEVHYINRFDKYKEELKEVLNQNIWLKVYTGVEIEYFKIVDFVNSQNEFVLLTNNENHEEVYNNLKRPIVIATRNSMYSGPFLQLKKIFLNIFDFNRELIIYEDLAYLVINCNSIISDSYMSVFRDISNYEVSDVIKISSNKIATTLELNKLELIEDDSYYGEVIVNLNHPFVNYTLESIDKITEDNEIMKVFNEAYELISSITYGQTDIRGGVVELNKIIKSLYDKEFSFKFKQSDFFINRFEF